MRRLSATKFLILPGLALLLFLFVAPLAVILKAGLFEDGGTSGYLARFISNGAYLEVMERTVAFSAIVSAICLFAGYPIAFFIARQTKKWRPLLVFLIFVPMWMSILVRTYSWMILLGREGIVNATLMKLGLVSTPLRLIYTTGSVYLVLVQVLLPFMVMTCYSAMAEIDETHIRAARLLGARPLSAFLRVFLPLSLEGAVSGFVLVFMLSMGVFVVPGLVGGPRDTMMANLIATQVEQTNWGFGAALALVLLATTLAAMSVIRLATRRFVFSPARETAA